MKLAEATDNTPLPENMAAPKNSSGARPSSIDCQSQAGNPVPREGALCVRKKAEHDEKLAKREKQLSETGKL
ncbi:MAG: hypothetical protein M0R47_05050 [Methylobacter sp.]|uniref:hypothetical protein n=1 Tax=Methylobacter sp. TaxID=2051955 RepID=UPI0025D9CA32|nr:hypothetical protein [Methylobacter sp.]MCK9619884.1 hypothetical protein [Methylobacter sp.]